MRSSRTSRVLALSGGRTFAKLLAVATNLLIIRLLCKEDVAAYLQTFLAYAAVLPFIKLGVDQGIYYFVPSDKANASARVCEAIGILFILSSAFAAFIALGGSFMLASRFSNPALAPLLVWLIPHALASIPSLIADSVLVAVGRVRTAAIFTVVRQLLVACGTFVPLLIWRTVEAPVIGHVTAGAIASLLAVLLMVKSVPGKKLLPSVHGMMKFLSLILPIGVGGLFDQISAQLDKLLVAFLCTPAEFAVFSLGAIEFPLIGIVTGAITSVLLVDMRKAVTDGDLGEAVELFRKTARASAKFILPAMIFCLLNAKEIVEVALTSAYAGSVVPFRWYLLLLPARIVVFASFLVALGLSRYLLVRAVIGLAINLILSFTLVSYFGPSGAAASTVFVTYAWSVASSVYVISRATGVAPGSLLPLEDILRGLLPLLPIIILCILMSLVVQAAAMRICLSAVTFSIILGIYWKNSIRDYFLRRAAKSGRPRR